MLKDNPDLGDRGCAALAKAAARTPTLSRLDLARCGCGPQTGFALADELCFQFSVEKPNAWIGVRAPGADVEVIDTKPRAPPPDPRPHLSVGLSRNFELGNDAINRLAFVAERSKYRLGVECSSDLYGDEAGLMLAGLPAKDRRFVISSKTVVAAPAPSLEMFSPTILRQSVSLEPSALLTASLDVQPEPSALTGSVDEAPSRLLRFEDSDFAEQPLKARFAPVSAEPSALFTASLDPAAMPSALTSSLQETTDDSASEVERLRAQLAESTSFRDDSEAAHAAEVARLESMLAQRDRALRDESVTLHGAEISRMQEELSHFQEQLAEREASEAQRLQHQLDEREAQQTATSPYKPEDEQGGASASPCCVEGFARGQTAIASGAGSPRETNPRETTARSLLGAFGSRNAGTVHFLNNDRRCRLRGCG